MLIFSLTSCLDQIDLAPTSGQENALVVQGVLLKGNPSQVSIRIDRVFNFSPSSFGKVSAFEGYIIDQDGTRLKLAPRGEGLLQLDIPNNQPDFPIEYNRVYRIELQMPNGNIIVSELEPLLPVPKVDSIHWERVLKFVPDPLDEDKSILDTFIRFSIDTQLKLKSQTDYGRFRWLGDRTFKITELPQFGGIRDTCYISESTAVFGPKLYDGNVLKNDYLNQQVIYDQLLNFKLAEGYVFSVYQESLSEGAFTYWDQIGQTLNRTGNMFETPAGITFSNISYENNQTENIYGYFYCTERDTLHRYIPPMDIVPPVDSFCPRFIGGQNLEIPQICLQCEIVNRSVTRPPPFWITGFSFPTMLLWGL